MAKSLIDTDIFSEITRGIDANVSRRAASYIQEEGRLTISVVTVMEVVKGLHKAGRAEHLERFLLGLDALEVLPFGSAEATEAGRIYADLERQGTPIGRADPMIAATAVAHGLVLVTGNEEHFERVRTTGRELAIENWRR